MRLRAFYYRYFQTRYFNKLLLMYIGIIVTVILLLGNFVTRNVNEMLIRKEIKFNDIVLLNMTDYFNAQIKMVKVILQQAYLDAYASDDIFYFLENDMDSLTYLEKKPIFDSFFFEQFSRSKDIVNIYVHKKLDDRVYQYSKATIADNFPVAQFKYPNLLVEGASKASGIVIQAAYSPHFFNAEPNGLVYSLSIPIKRKGSSANIGTLVVELDPQGFGDILNRLDKESVNQILVLLNGNEVIYDSTDRYYNTAYPYADQLKGPTVDIGNHRSLVSTAVTGHPRVSISVLVPLDSILRKTEDIRRTIYTLTLASIAVCIALILISSSAFSRKVKVVVNAMKDFRHGDVTKRIPVKKASDEIDQIAIGFNKMSAELSEYIERVYLSEIERQNAELDKKNLELRQKSIELSALQARINPHFLYNTLEAIRMKALSAKEPSIADMIYILSDLFRSSLSAKYVVTLEEELTNAELYMQLFGIRYRENIAFEAQAEPSILDYGVIKHILQPILENYTIHGYRPGDSDNKVKLRAVREDADVVIAIQDNGKGIPPDRLTEINGRLDGDRPDNGPGGMGLPNVHGRLQLVFGERYGLKLESIAGLGTSVTVRVPIVSTKELKEHVESIDRR